VISSEFFIIIIVHSLICHSLMFCHRLTSFLDSEEQVEDGKKVDDRVKMEKHESVNFDDYIKDFKTD